MAVKDTFCCCSGPRLGAIGFRALSDSSRKVKSAVPRNGPPPGVVVMSTNAMPPPWFSAANRSRRKRIPRICDFGGSFPPRNPSTRTTASGPAICFSVSSISSGSSGSASICSRVSRLPKALPLGSVARSRGSCPTVISSASFAISSFISRRASPRKRSSARRFTANPGASAVIS